MKITLGPGVELAPELVEKTQRAADALAVEHRGVRDQPDRNRQPAARQEITNRLRHGGELGRRRRLAVARERHVGQPAQRRSDRVEWRDRPEIRRRGLLELGVELADQRGDVDRGGPAGCRPVDLTVGTVEIADLVRVQVHAHRQAARAARHDRVHVPVRFELTAVVLVIEDARRHPG
jgi:hypothetical protein